MVYEMAKNDNFGMYRHDLGGHTDMGLDKASVDNALLYSANDLPTQCYVCTSPQPKYQVLPKKPKDDSALLQGGLFICEHCAKGNTLDKALYGLRSLFD